MTSLAPRQFIATRSNEAPLTLLAPFEREQGRRICRRRCAGICADGLLQAAEAGLQLVGGEVDDLMQRLKQRGVHLVSRNAASRAWRSGMPDRCESCRRDTR